MSMTKYSVGSLSNVIFEQAITVMSMHLGSIQIAPAALTLITTQLLALLDLLFGLQEKIAIYISFT